MISEGTESNLPPKSCTWRGQSTVSYKEKSLYCFNMISTWIARWSLEIKGSSSKLRLTRSMNSVVKWEIIASFSYDLYLDHRMALGERGWYLKVASRQTKPVGQRYIPFKNSLRNQGFHFLSWSWGSLRTVESRVSPVDEGVNQEQVGVFLAQFAPPFFSERGSWLVSGIIP